MAIVQVNNIGTGGIISDIPPEQLPPHLWSSGANVRFYDGKVSKFPGEEAVYGATLDEPHFLFPWNYPSEYRWVYASGTGIYYTQGVNHFDITRYTSTPGDNPYTAGSRPRWNGALLGGVPIMNHTNMTDYPQQWDGTLGQMKDLENWPASTYARVIRSYGNFLIALDITKGTTNYPYMVKWSHPADPGTVPVSWDETDPTRLAGENVLAQTGGKLVDCLQLGGANIVYKEDSIWLQQLSRGQYVFSWRELDNANGLLTQRCVKPFMGRHFCVGRSDVYVFDGRSVQSIITNKLRRWFFKQIHPDWWQYIQAVPNYAKQEMWVCFCSASNSEGYFDKALVWNWNSGAWTIREFDTSAQFSHIGYGQVSSGLQTFDTTAGTFDAQTGAFGDAGSSPADYQLLGGSIASGGGGGLLKHIDEGYTWDATAYRSYLERLALPIAGQGPDGPKVDPSTVKFVREIYPKISGTSGAQVQVYIGGQMQLDDPVEWEGPYTFTVGQTEAIPCATIGRFISLRFDDANSQSAWEMTGYALDLDVISRF